MWFGKRVITFCGLFIIFISSWHAFGSDKRDPFVPLVTKSGQLLISKPTDKNINLVLKGIIYSPPKDSIAIINDEVFREKATVGDYIVVRIEEKRVILKKDKEEIILKWEGE
ncbi:MAG: hypothetical protein NC935_06975 [Candidatus Omnitrophica bacterium]|nr:hypothetical protein [Candidatus Omnitrophota bacterium]